MPRVASSHSWLDCIGWDVPYHGGVQFFSSDFYVEYCKGYGRGYPGRFNRFINDIYSTQVVGRGGNDPASVRVCGSTAQTLNYSSEFPMLVANPGQTIKLWYQMDNHYRPATTFNVFTFGVPGKTIDTYADQLNATKVLKHPFAETQNCYDVAFPNTWCWAFWTIPSDWTPGTYSFLWNWPWDGNPIGEEFNTCFDIDVTNSKVAQLPSS
ncbi:hypothetical protein L0F63_005767 [Massospora cicadina]|nr:hypothetical protein L0F63_005767 [Massospora cicadina]